MFDFIRGSWRRGRDTAATLRDLELLEGRLSGAARRRGRALARRGAPAHRAGSTKHASEAEDARRAFEAAGDVASEAQALRLLGHIASRPRRSRRRAAHAGRARPRALRAARRRSGARAGARSSSARSTTCSATTRGRAGHAARRPSSAAPSSASVLGRAQCLILLALIEERRRRCVRARDLLMEARAEFDTIGYRLGIAQCDIALGHADHRGLRASPGAGARALPRAPASASSRTRAARPACERLLAMIALDTDDYAAAAAHARVAQKIYDRLQDPWGALESQLLLAQVALARGRPSAPRRSSPRASASSSTRPSPASTATSRSPGSHRRSTAGPTPRWRLTARAWPSATGRGRAITPRTSSSASRR